MAAAFLLGFDSIARGDGSLALAGGSYSHIRPASLGGFATRYTADVTSIGYAAGSASDYAAAADPPRFLNPPTPGDRVTRVYTGGAFTITVPDATKWLTASIYCFTDTAESSLNVKVQDVDAAFADLLSITSTSVRLGFWTRFAFRGSIRIQHQSGSTGVSGTFVTPYVAHMAGAVPPTAFGHYAL